MKSKETVLDDGLLAISGLARALDGTAGVSDVGALIWALLPQVVPCHALALFVPDDWLDQVVVRYAAGAHAHALIGVSRPIGMGVAGWAAANRTAVVNAEPVLDLSFRASAVPALRSSVVVPLVESDVVVAVLSLYSTELLAYTDDHVQLLELLAPRLASALIDAVIAEEDVAAPAKRPVLRLVPSLRNCT